ncbi:MAG: hypothetical protein JWP76_3839 [Dactylosporangium sp.]|nr:hypothetical protein [Dactylosporangium sp.]
MTRTGTIGLSGDGRLGRRLKAENTIIGTDLGRLMGRVNRVERAVDDAPDKSGGSCTGWSDPPNAGPVTEGCSLSMTADSSVVACAA